MVIMDVASPKISAARVRIWQEREREREKARSYVAVKTMERVGEVG